MNRWEHLFYGEFAERRKLLSGLTLEQVNHSPFIQAHSIFAELWHTVLWQNILVGRDEALYEQTWQRGERYPAHPAQSLAEWEALVEDFLDGLTRALAWTLSAEKLNMEVDPGVTMAGVLHGLAVHNAYHLGKIVALRQMLGCWPE
ncbi:DinB family protein [Deinococcus sp.]|uniref:DinB family protein n=1 Tax=Deinococcus sp. TaxID=47478 RepID=UPI003CC5CDE0